MDGYPVHRDVGACHTSWWLHASWKVGRMSQLNQLNSWKNPLRLPEAGLVGRPSPTQARRPGGFWRSKASGGNRGALQPRSICAYFMVAKNQAYVPDYTAPETPSSSRQKISSFFNQKGRGQSKDQAGTIDQIDLTARQEERKPSASNPASSSSGASAASVAVQAPASTSSSAAPPQPPRRSVRSVTNPALTRAMDAAVRMELATNVDGTVDSELQEAERDDWDGVGLSDVGKELRNAGTEDGDAEDVYEMALGEEPVAAVSVEGEAAAVRLVTEVASSEDEDDEDIMDVEMTGRVDRSTPVSAGPVAGEESDGDL